MKLLISVLMLAASSLGFGQDLPAQSTISQATMGVNVYEVSSVEVTGQRLEQQNRMLVGLLNIAMNVEGNICGADPESLAFSRNWIESDVLELRLSVSMSHDPEPGVFLGCASYSSGAETNLAIALDSYRNQDGDFSDFKSTYRIYIGYGRSEFKDVIVKVLDGSFVAEVL